MRWAALCEGVSSMQVSRHLLRRSCAVARPSPDRSRSKVIPLVQGSLRSCACSSLSRLRTVVRLHACMPARQPCHSSLSGMSATLPNTLLKRLVTLMDLKRAQWALSEKSRSRRDRPARPSPPRYAERWNAYVGHSLS